MGVLAVQMAVAAAAIYFACDFFTNGVEWLGRRTGLSQTATGSLLAAFGTALPESIVTLNAVAFGSGLAQQDIGIGAAMGGPMVLSTFGYGMIGLMVLRWRRLAPVQSLPLRWLARDQFWFLALFAGAAVLGLAHLAWKPVFGLFLIAAYALYVHGEIAAADEPDAAVDLAPLAFRPREDEPGLRWIALQLGLSLVAIFVAARIFVGGLETLGATLGLSPQVAALLLSPIATEMPEMMNSILWMRQGKIQLALANISGAMMIQATIPAAFGLIFTPWLFEGPVIAAAALTLFATALAMAIVNARRAAWAG